MYPSVLFFLSGLSTFLVLLPPVDPFSSNTSSSRLQGGDFSCGGTPIYMDNPLARVTMLDTINCISKAVNNEAITWDINVNERTCTIASYNQNSRYDQIFWNISSDLIQVEASFVRVSTLADITYLRGVWQHGDDWKNVLISSVVKECFYRSNMKHGGAVDGDDNNLESEFDADRYLDMVFDNARSGLTYKYGKTNWKFTVVICTLMTAAGVSAILLVLHKKITSKSTSNISCTSEAFASDILCKKLSYQELALATDNFSSENMLGKGGTSSVYRGYLSNCDKIVAVKRICSRHKYATEVFTTELKIMILLDCTSIVPLIGWSNDQDEYLIVYDYMPNGGLDKHLFGNGMHLPWNVRLNIVLNLAFALLYLHEESGHCILHRDIKSANVMLDLNFNAKLGDFGVSMFLDPNLSHQTTKVVGTFGYIAPEYYQLRRASEASDIYSFGIVLLEVATGKRKCRDEDSHMGLVEWVWNLYGAGKIVDAADERLGMDFDVQEMECLLILGLWCAHPVDKQRPSARQAFQVLKFEAQLPQLPEEMPSLMYSKTAPSPVYSDPPSITFSLQSGR